MSTPNSKEQHDTSMPLGAHLEELRGRLIRSMVLLAVILAAAWVFREEILSVLFRPHVQTAMGARVSTALKYRDYMEPVAVQIKACLAVAIAVSMPYLLYQVWAFVAPGLYRNERLFFTRLLGVSIFCFLAGALFGFFLFIPVALRFLLSLAPAQTEPMLMMGSYLSLFLMMTVALGIVFQTPLVVYYLISWNIVSAGAVKANRRNAIFGAFILAAFFTPPDPVTQVMMAVPIIVLFELGILVAAPARETFTGFMRLAGLLALVVALAWTYYHYYPVARLAGYEGDLSINGVPMREERSLRLQRGTLIELNGPGHVLLHPGLWGDKEAVIIGDDSSVVLRDGGGIILEKGAVLTASRRPGRLLRVQMPGGEVSLREGLAEMRTAGKESFNVTVAEGRAEVLYGGRVFELSEGRTRSFRPEDEPAGHEAIREKWGDLY